MEIMRILLEIIFSRCAIVQQNLEPILRVFQNKEYINYI